ncbi:MAG: hypothetical protein UY71_C0006G0024 [Parcubacteria group bacterium GW2011_GWB1_52_7]|nr:MAG: hypothetical protein UY64_C0002G0004 [Parcubacteria group bacterium GW2011_GWA1_51_12]KKW28989.1 MAG: hypothetical protein UY71_C0006G0024 [Parcubacteria group bacterium GW2011_GWB1_52_7]
MDIEYRHFKIFILSILALLLAAFIGFVYFSAKESVQTFGGTPVIVGGTAVAAEVVSSPFLRARGLSSRQFLGELEGMLFVFERPSRETFWMKDMLFPIDIIWIRSRTVVGAAENLQPPAEGTPDAALSLYSSPVPVDQVLEVPAGFVQRHNIQPGDPVIVKTR